MTKARPSTKTMSKGAIEPALFTHDGYRLHVFDGVPCMLDTDLGARLGMAESKAIRKLIKRQEDNLILLGNLGRGVPNPSSDLRRRPLEREPGKAGWPAAGFVDTEIRCFMRPEVPSTKACGGVAPETSIARPGKSARSRQSVAARLC